MHDIGLRPADVPLGATFEDLYQRGRPQVSINATDMGQPFGFLPQTFAVISSYLRPSRSPGGRRFSRLSGAFIPVTLRNYRGPLPSPVPPQAWERAENDFSCARTDPKHRYSSDQRTAVDLSDGRCIRIIWRCGCRWMTCCYWTPGRIGLSGLLPVRRILVITVDGQSAPNPNWPRQRIVSGLGQIISAVSADASGAYNIETLIAVEAAVLRPSSPICARCAAADARLFEVTRAGRRCGKVLQVSLSEFRPDPETRARLVASPLRLVAARPGR